MTKTVDGREIVLAVLMEINENGAYSHIVLREVLEKYQYLDKKTRAFITRVTEGTLERQIEIDYILDQFSKVRVKKMKPVIRNLLRSAVYQLKYMDSIPDHAVCGESVRLAGKKGFRGLKGYVNGVLRAAARGLGDVKYPEEEKEALSVKYSCPRWIIELWEQSCGMDETEKMLSDMQREKPLCVRCCLNRITPEELVGRWETEGVRAERHPYLDYVFYITGYDYLDGLDSFREGLFAVQDISSVLVGETADIRPGMQVIDVCAAPGGKTLHIAERLAMAERNAGAEKAAATENSAGGAGHEGTQPERGHVEARDLTEYKAELIRENIARSGLDNISAAVKDASVPDEESVDKADLVIADLPCSGLGVMGKKADLKYRVQPDDLPALIELQRGILSCARRYVKPGGTLMYSTCTVNPGENIENVRWFLRQYPEFELKSPEERLCGELAGSVEEGCLQLLPGVHNSDGFFIAKLARRDKTKEQ